MATPYSLIRLDETGSTQDDARLAHAGRPVVVVADRQHRGRGRSGAEWVTATRAVAVSVAWEPAWPVADRGLIPLVAGWSVCEAVDRRLRLKWPNDVLLDGAKVGGILVEASGDLVVAGLGLNLWWPDAPDGMGALAVSDPGRPEADRVAEAWAGALLDVTVSAESGWSLDRYREVCDTLGRPVRWDPDGQGRAVDVAPDGGLVVETAAGRTVLRSGAVRHLRSTGY